MGGDLTHPFPLNGGYPVPATHCRPSVASARNILYSCPQRSGFNNGGSLLPAKVDFVRREGC